MIDIRKLKELVRLMVANELTELDLRDSEEQVTLRRNNAMEAPETTVAPNPGPATGTAVLEGPPAPAVALAEPPEPSGPAEASELLTIESPMVGTFYAGSSPDSAPFVSEGSEVTPDSVVCIIEAMKIFNEIRAECSGTIVKTLVQIGEAVEFGQPLFLVKPV